MNKTYENFRVNQKQLAEQLWGKGGTNSTRTNRKGVTWYSCSGHGGMIIDEALLTLEEKKILFREEKNIETYEVRVCVQFTPQGERNVLGVSSPFTYKRRSISYNPGNGQATWINRRIYVFEEDCSWSIAAKFLNIFPVDMLEKYGLEKSKEIAEETYNRWFNKSEKELDYFERAKQVQDDTQRDHSGMITGNESY